MGSQGESPLSAMNSLATKIQDKEAAGGSPGAFGSIPEIRINITESYCNRPFSPIPMTLACGKDPPSNSRATFGQDGTIKRISNKET